MTQLTLNKAETIKLSFTFCVLLGLGLGPIGSSNTVQFEPENIHRWGKYPYMAGLQFYYFGFNWFTGAQKTTYFLSVNSCLVKRETSGQSYKHFMLVNYDSRVVPDWKIPHISTLEL